MVDMYCFKDELGLVLHGKRETLVLYTEPGIGHGKVIKVTVEQKQGRSLLG
jgi:hypothetical protein